MKWRRRRQAIQVTDRHHQARTLQKVKLDSHRVTVLDQHANVYAEYVSNRKLDFKVVSTWILTSCTNERVTSGRLSGPDPLSY